MIKLDSFLRFNTSNNKLSAIAERELGASNFIPYLSHYRPDTLITKDGQMIKIIKVEGFSFETVDDEDVDIKKDLLNQLLRTISSGGWILNFYMIRRNHNSFSDNFATKRTKVFFVDYINDVYREKMFKKNIFINELYISIVKKGSIINIGPLKGLVDQVNKRFFGVQEDTKWKELYEELEEVTNRICSSLREYFPHVLTIKKTSAGVFSESLEFFSKIINCGESYPVLMPKGPISSSISRTRLYFGEKLIEAVGPTSTKYAGIVSIREYGQTTNAGMMDGFLHIQNEIIMTQSFEFVNRQMAIGKMQIQQNRMIQAGDQAISQIAEITKALDDSMSGRVAFGKHNLSVLCLSTNKKVLETAMSMIEVELGNAGIIPVREKINLEPSFWGQLPGNTKYIVRRSLINSLNLASFAPLHNYPCGKKDNNFWGEAVTILNTSSGTPFFFNFHVRDVGHTMIVGPTGAGKTVLMNFLAAQLLKFNPNMFFFDKDRGAEIFIRSVDAQHITIEPRNMCNLNPLKLDDTPENRTFLFDWFKALIVSVDPEFHIEYVELINEAIDGCYRLDKSYRQLKNLIPFFGLGGPGSLVSKLSMWVEGGTHAGLFDNKEDALDLKKTKVVGFEMQHLLSDKAALAPTLLYLFHRIQLCLDGSPTVIILDEAWALIDNPVFAPKLKDWLKVLRKLNTFVVFATQSVEDIGKSSISDTLIQQTATQIFLPNLKATNIYRDIFMLSAREYALVKFTDPSSRCFIVKQGISSVVATIDLSGLNDVISVLSGRADTVRLLDKICEEVGRDPYIWLPIYFKRVEELQ